MKYFTPGKVIHMIMTLTCMICILYAMQDACAQDYLKRSVFSNGAGRLSNASYILSSTLGQPVIGKVSNSLYRNHVGFWYYDDQFVATIDEGIYLLPKTYELFQNYPNPFYPVTVIRYALPNPAFVHLEVYNPLGQLISTLVNSTMPGGVHAVYFRAGNLPAGSYIYSIRTDEFHEVKRMVLIRQ